MCVALPGVVEKIEGERATVNFSGNRIIAHCGFVEAAPGDHVLVHAGYVMQVVDQSEADELAELLEELEEVSGTGGERGT